MHKIRFAIIENAGCALWKTRRKNANRIHRDNPKALSISKLPTNPSVLSLPYDHRCHTFRLLKKTDRKRYAGCKYYQKYFLIRQHVRLHPSIFRSSQQGPICSQIHVTTSAKSISSGQRIRFKNALHCCTRPASVAKPSANNAA